MCDKASVGSLDAELQQSFINWDPALDIGVFPSPHASALGRPLPAFSRIDMAVEARSPWPQRKDRLIFQYPIEVARRHVNRALNMPGFVLIGLPHAQECHALCD